MQAWILNNKAKEGYSCAQLPLPEPKADEVRVALKAAALNHRDIWCCEGKYPDIKQGCILGSDGAGVVEACGENASIDWQGQSVVINPGLNWGDRPEAQGEHYEILGMPSPGTFANYICVSANRLRSAPAYLSMEQAAALPLAALTAYRILFRQADLQNRQRILITGIGGGVAHMLLQMALARDTEVWVTSSDIEKIMKVQHMGAAGGFLYTDEKWVTSAERYPGNFDAIMDSAGGDLVSEYLRLLRPAGRLIVYGATRGLPRQLDLPRLFWKQLRIQGSTMGNDEEFAHMLRLVASYSIVPLIDSVFDFEEFPKALNRIKSGKQMGKVVLRCQESST